ncbi:MAG: thiamine diphosphokinase [Clostridia bacterium]|nr:thiamine diphosphokinase [Clostridia bacterium]
MRACLFGAGEYHGERRDLLTGAYIIAADGGYLHAQSVNVMPALLIGDFDSLPELPTYTAVKRHPVEKDDTDMALAVKEALDVGCDEIVIFGGMGKRLDHTLANLSLLLSLKRRGIRGYLVGEDAVISVMAAGEGLTFPVLEEGILSLFALSERAEVSLTGLQYPLTKGTLHKDRALGVSNHFIGERASVLLHEGELLVMWDTVNAPLPTWERM